MKPLSPLGYAGPVYHRLLVWQIGILLGSGATALTQTVGTFGFASYAFTTNENAGSALITVQRQGPLNGPAAVDYTTANQSAIAGIDYAPQSGSLVFAAGESNKTFSVPLIDNPRVEGNKTVGLLLSNPTSGSTLGYYFSAVLNILDNEQPNLVDGTFDPGSGLEGYDGSFGVALDVALQPDGKVLVGGDFNTVNGVLRKGLARLNAGGSIDADFNAAPGVAGKVMVITVQTNGKIVIGGDFIQVNGINRTNIARLNEDGTVDTNFVASTGSSSVVQSIAVQGDGKILVGGDFQTVNGVPRNYLARLNSNGSLDGTFNPGPLPTTVVRSIAVLPSGKIMVAGNNYDGSNRVVRLQSNGIQDPAFNVGTGIEGTYSLINGLVVQADGKTLVYGNFQTVNRVPRNGMVRFNPNGSVDENFATAFAGDTILDVALQPDGKILFARAFDFGSRALGRLNSNGASDPTFPPGAYTDNAINSIALQADGKVILGGAFRSVDNIARIGLARVTSTGSDVNGFDFTSNKFLVGEDGGTAIVTIRRSGDSGSSRTVSYATSPLAARPGIDYIEQTGAVTFEPLETIKSISIPILDNSLVERDKTIRLALSNPSEGGVLGLQSVATLTIEENERPVLIDTTFNPGTGANRKVYSMARQPDGKLVIGGQFVTINGISRRYVARLETNGAVDLTFDAGNLDGYVRAVALQPDGRIVIGGEFVHVGGAPHIKIARLNANGSLDGTFNGYVVGNSESIPWVDALLIQPDGRILVGGSFVIASGVSANNLARMETNGVADFGFYFGAGVGVVNSIALQGDGRILVGGTYGPQPLLRLQTNGVTDTNFSAHVQGYYSIIKSIAIQPDGKLVVGGLLQETYPGQRRGLDRFNPDGTFDATFNIGSSANNSVNAVVLQADGKIVVGGEFFSINGIPTRRLARLNVDGTLDDSFLPGKGANDEIQAIVVQPDGQIVFGGEFSSINGINIDHIARVHGSLVDSQSFDFNGDIDFKVRETDGFAIATLRRYGSSGTTVSASYTAVDITATAGADYLLPDGALTFNPLEVAKTIIIPIIDDGLVEGDETFQVALTHHSDGIETGLNSVLTVRIKDDEVPIPVDPSFSRSFAPTGDVYAVLVQPDGKILVAGQFSYGISNRNNIARFNPDGTLDAGFDLAGANSSVRALALQPDGHILLGGTFNAVNGNTAFYVGRLNSNGSFDPTFNSGGSLNNEVSAMALQPDGKVVIGGSFNTVGGISRNAIARLNSNASLDLGFNPGAGANDRVRAVALQSDGKVIIGGRFTSVNSIERRRIARLDSNGFLDLGFDPGTGPDRDVQAAAVQPDGSVILAGDFTQVAGVDHSCVARLLPNGNLDSSFHPLITHTTTWIVPLVSAVTLQPDGKIVIAGLFNSVNGFARIGVARLNPDGTLDRTFDPASTLPPSYSGENAVFAVALQPDGGIIVGGQSTSVYDPVSASYLYYRAQLLRFFGDSVDSSSVQFSLTDLNVAENSIASGITVERTGNTSGPLTVDYFTSDGTATAGSDYSPQSGTLSFGPLEKAKTIWVPIQDDELGEADETFFLRLQNPGNGALLGWRTNLTMRILDDERPGSVDPSFDGRIGTYPSLSVLALQPDGKMVIGGSLQTASGINRTNLARLLPNGSVDLSFSPTLETYYEIRGLALQPDGKMLVDNGIRFVRLNSDGSRDPTFTPDLIGGFPIVVQPDSKILYFSYDNHVYRLNPDGSADSSFISINMNSPTAPHVLALESDGHVLLTDGNRLYRYNSNGLLASGLATNWLNSACSISTIAIQSNGKILLGGSFQFADGLYRAVVRLNQNGLLDPDLVTTNSFVNTAVEQILPQADGRIIVLGSFSEIGGMRRNGIVRLKANGSVDPSFDPGTGVDYLSSDTFRSAVLQSDGKVLLLGHFYSINGTARTGLARLNGDMPMHIHPLGWVPSGAFKVRLDTLPGKTYVLQGSEDLVYWLALRTNSPSGYYVDFLDANAPAATRRFYRALQVQP